MRTSEVSTLLEKDAIEGYSQVGSTQFTFWFWKKEGGCTLHRLAEQMSEGVPCCHVLQTVTQQRGFTTFDWRMFQGKADQSNVLPFCLSLPHGTSRGECWEYWSTMPAKSMQILPYSGWLVRPGNRQRRTLWTFYVMWHSAVNPTRSYLKASQREVFIRLTLDRPRQILNSSTPGRTGSSARFWGGGVSSLGSSSPPRLD